MWPPCRRNSMTSAANSGTSTNIARGSQTFDRRGDGALWPRPCARRSARIDYLAGRPACTSTLSSSSSADERRPGRTRGRSRPDTAAAARRSSRAARRRSPASENPGRVSSRRNERKILPSTLKKLVRQLVQEVPERRSERRRLLAAVAQSPVRGAAIETSGVAAAPVAAQSRRTTSALGDRLEVRVPAWRSSRLVAGARRASSSMTISTSSPTRSSATPYVMPNSLRFSVPRADTPMTSARSPIGYGAVLFNVASSVSGRRRAEQRRARPSRRTCARPCAARSRP